MSSQQGFDRRKQRSTAGDNGKWEREFKEAVDKYRREHPLKPRIGGMTGCQPGQFADKPSWREW